MRSRHRLLLAGTLLLLSSGPRAEGAIYVLPSGHAVDQQGNVVAEGLPVTGAERDQVLGSHGQVYQADALHRNEAGQLAGPDGGTVQPGQQGQGTPTPGPAAANVPKQRKKPYKGPGVKMVVGGQSEEGVAKTTTLPILK